MSGKVKRSSETPRILSSLGIGLFIIRCRLANFRVVLFSKQGMTNASQLTAGGSHTSVSSDDIITALHHGRIPWTKSRYSLLSRKREV